MPLEVSSPLQDFGNQQQPELHVYSRRKNSQVVENPISTRHSQSSEPDAGNLSNFESYDLDVPIALRKGTRSCTQHPIANYVAYDHLSSSVRALVTNLAGVVVPKTIEEALKVPVWKSAVLEEMQALKKNKTWEVVKRPHGKIPVATNGFLQ